MKENKPEKDLSQPTGAKQLHTCHLGKQSLGFQTLQSQEDSYIHEHLMTLHFIVKEFECRNVLEIGTGPGHSTLAMVENTDAHVTTIDVEPCPQARDLVLWTDPYPNNVTFVQGKSDVLALEAWFDLIFIDGGHTYTQVMKDIKTYHHYVRDRGFLIFHDSLNPAHPGVLKAIREFLLTEAGEQYDRYHWFNCNGLVVLRKRIED